MENLIIGFIIGAISNFAIIAWVLTGKTKPVDFTGYEGKHD